MQLDREQAKRVLSASFREEESPSPVAEMAETEAALQMLETDPELAAWFEKELSFDTLVAESLSDVAVPDGLREACHESFALGEAEATDGSADTDSPASTPSRRPVLGLLLALSAVIALAALGGLRYFKKAEGSGAALPQYADFRAEMVDFISDRFDLAFKDPAFERLNDWVASEGGTRFQRLPQSIKSATSVGCNIIEWGGGRASLFCFMGLDGKPVHLLVTSLSTLDVPHSSEELAQQVDARGLKTVAWTEDGLLYMLCGSSPEVEISSFLGGENVANQSRSRPVLTASL